MNKFFRGSEKEKKEVEEKLPAKDNFSKLWKLGGVAYHIKLAAS